MLLEDLRVGRLVGLGEGNYIARDWEPVWPHPEVDLWRRMIMDDGTRDLIVLVRRLVYRDLPESRDQHEISEAPLTSTVVFNDGAVLRPHLGPARMFRQYMSALSWSQQSSTGSRQGGRGSRRRGDSQPCIMSLKGPRKQRTSKAASKW
jgi:hypothetical protein